MSDHPWMSGLLGDPEIDKILSAGTVFSRYLHVEAAWTRALGRVAGEPSAEAAAQAIETANLAPGDLQEGFANDGVPIPALVKALRHAVGPEAADFVHTGLTSQDVMDTALVLTLQEVHGVLDRRLLRLRDSLTALGATYGKRRIMGFTRMQPALEVDVAEVIARWLQPIPGLLAEAERVRDALSILQWGGPVGVRDHALAAQIGIAFAEMLNLRDPGKTWHTDRTGITSSLNLMAQITVMTGKIGEDVALMAAVGPEQIILKGGSSSAMQHKVNPVKAEVLIALADWAAMLQSSALRSARHEGLRSGRAWTLEWLTLQQMSQTAGVCLRLCLALMEDVLQMGFETSSRA